MRPNKNQSRTLDPSIELVDPTRLLKDIKATNHWDFAITEESQIGRQWMTGRDEADKNYVNTIR